LAGRGKAVQAKGCSAGISKMNRWRIDPGGNGKPELGKIDA
jgi:hypothetical protein